MTPVPQASSLLHGSKPQATTFSVAEEEHLWPAHLVSFPAPAHSPPPLFPNTVGRAGGSAHSGEDAPAQPPSTAAGSRLSWAEAAPQLSSARAVALATAAAVGVTSSDLSDLVSLAASRALDESTTATYKSHVNSYLAFCRHYNLEAFPVTREPLAKWFVFHVITRKLSPTSLGTMFSAVKDAAQRAAAQLPSAATISVPASGLLLSPIDEVVLRRVREGLGKIAGRAVRHKLPVTHDMIETADKALRGQFGGRDLPLRLEVGLIAIRVAQACLLRVSEYGCGPSLLAKHAQVVDSSSGSKYIVFHLHDCKTASPGEVQRVELHEPVAVAGVCRILERRKPDEPLFMSVSDGAETGDPMSRYYLTKLLREVLIAAGLDADAYSSHSLRAGGATDLVRAGVLWPDLMRVGRWLSPTVPLAYVAMADDYSKRVAGVLANSRAGRSPQAFGPRPAAITGPSVLPWTSIDEKKKMLEAVEQALTEMAAPEEARAQVAALRFMPDAPTEPAPSFTGAAGEPSPPDTLASEAELVLVENTGASLGSKRRRAADSALVPARVPARERETKEEISRRWERFTWDHADFRSKLVSAGNRNNTRLLRRLENLRLSVKEGLRETKDEEFAAMHAKWLEQETAGAVADDPFAAQPSIT